MRNLTASLPGYATVARAGEVLHLAPRSVRDLIYSGRLPSLRIGRLHYIRAADLEAERRRRVGLPMRRSRVARRRVVTPSFRAHAHVDPAVRAARAAERQAAREQWAQTHRPAAVELPFRVLGGGEPTVCARCHAALTGRRVEHRDEALCTRCARRALHTWADDRRAEAAAARHLADELAGHDADAPRMRAA